jgi:hypothetical protein
LKGFLREFDPATFAAAFARGSDRTVLRLLPQPGKTVGDSARSRSHHCNITRRKTVISNLCLCCRTCNGHKGQITTARDPATGRTAKLFHPRRQKWPEHFQWGADGARILGLTATGRATIEALQMNNDLIVNLRSLWVVLRLHPAK